MLSSGNIITLAVCSFTVSVPVLSLAITVQLPNDSTLFNFFTITFFFCILLEDTVSAIVSARGSPSGIAETERAITEVNILIPSYPFIFKIIEIIIAINIVIKLICFENFSILIVSGDLVSLALLTSFAILPISVLIPVSTTMPTALPLNIEVPA